MASGGGDTTAPTTSLTAPSAGTTVRGTVTVSASASDNVGLSKVEFYAGSTLLGTDTTEPYTWDWDTTTSTTGTKYLKTRAFDPTGNSKYSALVSVTVTR